MSVPYLLRLLCLSLASFFVVNLVAGLAAALVSRAAIRIAEKMRPRSGARLLFLLRLLPTGLGVGAVLGLCVPSYLWLEPQSASERIGFVCLALALLGTAGWSLSTARAARAVATSLRFTRAWQQTGCGTPLAGEASRAVVIEKNTPLLALAGVLWPRLVISRGVLRTLSNEQLDLALEHEHAHRDSRDNLKRLFFLLTPAVFPFAKEFSSLEQKWAEFSEWAADDEAVRGDSNRALSLAATLLLVARMGAGPRLSYLHTSLVAGDHNLAVRVDRLLHVELLRPERPIRKWFLAVGAAFGFAVSGLAISAGPAALKSVHRVLELFVR